MAYHKSLVLFFGFVGFISIAGACTCFPSSNNQKFCNADFVIKAKVKKTMEIPAQFRIKHYLKIKKVYKANDEFDDLSSAEQKVLWTFTEPSLCGLYLDKGKTYLLAGFVNVDTKSLGIGSCDWATPWKNLPKKEKKNLKKVYGKGNNCDTLPDINIPLQVNTD